MAPNFRRKEAKMALTALPGTARTPAGLIVPAGMETLVAQLSEDNQKFLKLKEDIHVESLAPAVLARYLKSTEVVRDGVIYYEPKGKDSHKELADLIMDELTIQCHRRVPYNGMTAELFEQLKALKDPTSGESYAAQMTKFKFGVDAAALHRFFDKNGADQGTVTNIMGNISNRWFQRELTDTIRAKYQDNPASYKAGIENFKASNLGVAGEYTPERLNPMGVEDLLGAYVEVVGEGLGKIGKTK